MRPGWCWNLFVLIVAALPGCGGAKLVAGGTDGILHSGSVMLSDIQITVHQAEGSTIKVIGFAVPQSNGTFQLVVPEAKGPLRLATGDYRCTLESVGATVEIPKEFMKPDTTPLRITWSASDQKMDIDLPPLKPTR